MPIPLRVLIVSDLESDALQLIDALRQSDYVPSFERVDHSQPPCAKRWRIAGT
jgi:hypothetical protein